MTTTTMEGITAAAPAPTQAPKPPPTMTAAAGGHGNVSPGEGMNANQQASPTTAPAQQAEGETFQSPKHSPQMHGYHHPYGSALGMGMALSYRDSGEQMSPHVMKNATHMPHPTAAYRGPRHPAAGGYGLKPTRPPTLPQSQLQAPPQTQTLAPPPQPHHNQAPEMPYANRPPTITGGLGREGHNEYPPEAFNSNINNDPAMGGGGHHLRGKQGGTQGYHQYSSSTSSASPRYPSSPQPPHRPVAHHPPYSQHDQYGGQFRQQLLPQQSYAPNDRRPPYAHERQSHLGNPHYARPPPKYTYPHMNGHSLGHPHNRHDAHQHHGKASTEIPSQRRLHGRPQLPIQSVVTSSFSMDEERDCRGASSDPRSGGRREDMKFPPRPRDQPAEPNHATATTSPAPAPAPEAALGVSQPATSAEAASTQSPTTTGKPTGNNVAAQQPQTQTPSPPPPRTTAAGAQPGETAGTAQHTLSPSIPQQIQQKQYQQQTPPALGQQVQYHPHGMPPQPPAQAPVNSYLQQQQQQQQYPHTARELPSISEHAPTTTADPRITQQNPTAGPDRVPPSPRVLHDRMQFHRTMSTSSSSTASKPLKRSFWHHSRPDDEYQPGIPSEFIPPKRTKVGRPSQMRGMAGPNMEHNLASRSSNRDGLRGGNGGVGGMPPRHHMHAPPQQQQQQQQSFLHRHMSMSTETAPVAAAASENGQYAHFHRRTYSDSWDKQHHSPPSFRETNYTVWPESPSITSPSSRFVSPESGMAGWNGSRSNSWNPHSPSDYPWNSQHLPSWYESRDDAEMRRQGTFDSVEYGFNPANANQQHFQRSPFPSMPHQKDFGLGGGGPHASMPSPPHPFRGLAPVNGSRLPPQGSQSMAHQQGSNPAAPGIKAIPTEKYRLLALPEDRISLSETLCLVRENIEVFTATTKDVEAPAPGRKHPVQVGQVGLRCVHCRHTTKASERVKRAVCYPSSIRRIYRTVIDMKLDHLPRCKFVPDSLKDTLQAMRANTTRSTGTTMQYFIRAANSIGMVDCKTGVRMVDGSIGNASEINSTSTSVFKPVRVISKVSVQEQPVAGASPGAAGAGANTRTLSVTNSPGSSGSTSTSGRAKNRAGSTSDMALVRNASMASTGIDSLSPGATKDTGAKAGTGTDSDSEGNIPQEMFMGKASLSQPEDKQSLSPLRCFLRQQVCAFTATEEDIAVRTPTSFSVTVGQVGIACVHCLNLPPKQRTNRAVCFPFSVTRIYQSVADIQRFHMHECKQTPPEVRARFIQLQEASSKGSKGLATRQYWITSAKKIGLVDTPTGIRFNRDPEQPEAKPFSLDILAQVASKVKTTNKPLVMPEDKPRIAEFLYVVMAQLQPCRFTEADRNKRRLKDVGCIGVECKHCAGTVDGRKFFWSSVSAVESNFVSVHTHMIECKAAPPELKDQLTRLKKLRKQQTAALKTGSQKAFFTNVWNRLHQETTTVPKQEDKHNEDKKDKEETGDGGGRPDSVKKKEAADVTPITATSSSNKNESESEVNNSSTDKDNTMIEVSKTPSSDVEMNSAAPMDSSKKEGNQQKEHDAGASSEEDTAAMITASV